MMKKMVAIFALFFLVGSLFVLGGNDAGDSAGCSFWCKVKQVLSGRKEAAG